MPASVDDLVRIRRGRQAASTGFGRTVRLGLGISLRELAAVVGVSAAAVHQWENGRSLPSGENAIRYLRALEALEALARREVGA